MVPSAAACGSSAAGVDLGHLPVARDRVAQRDALLVGEAGQQPVGGEDGEAGVLERDQAHQHVAMAALAADLVRVDARGLVAVMAVGDQQLGVAQRVGDLGRGVLLRHAPEPVLGAVLVGHVAPRHAFGVGGHRAPRGAGRVVVEREDGGEVRPRRAREPQAVLPRPRVGALVGPDAPRAVVLDTHAREEPAAGVGVAVGAAVVLRERPQRRRGVAHEDLLRLPRGEQPRGVGVRVEVAVGPGQVDLDDVVRRAGGQRGSLLRVDHVVGRRHDGRQAADVVEGVVDCLQGLDVGHESG